MEKEIIRFVEEKPNYTPCLMNCCGIKLSVRLGLTIWNSEAGYCLKQYRRTT